MTRKEICVIKSRYSAATDGPWTCGKVKTTGEDYKWCDLKAGGTKDIGLFDNDMSDNYRNDVLFVANARFDIPALVLMLERAARIIEDFPRGRDMSNKALEWHKEWLGQDGTN